MDSPTTSCSKHIGGGDTSEESSTYSLCLSETRSDEQGTPCGHNITKAFHRKPRVKQEMPKAKAQETQSKTICISPPKLHKAGYLSHFHLPQHIQSDLLLVIYKSEMTASWYVQHPQEICLSGLLKKVNVAYQKIQLLLCGKEEHEERNLPAKINTKKDIPQVDQCHSFY
ncbi:hypothetical protein Anapl_12858 [Anas platyrhynchos]|uniref:Uncharacterized protein n=1 Tax=Anas platyrhynchos TaxID=8839 RepID=R0JBY3_ANAPL|nr:hypothetical protein Anapl_12858 [Anas platyrhynchos]